MGKERNLPKGRYLLGAAQESNFQAEQSFAELWADREEQMILGKRIAVMGEENRYSALIIYAVGHGFLRFRWLLDLYELQKRRSSPGRKPIAGCVRRARRTASGDYADDVCGNGVSLVREWIDYDRQLPECINQKSCCKILIVCGPSTYDFELIDLPDSMFWLYFIIRPCHWLWRKLAGKISH